MRIGAIQSSFIPWRGYFDFIASVDVFVFLDDVQYTKRDWRSRNKIKTPKGTEWLTVPVCYECRSQLIQQSKIDYSQNWVKQHLNAWQVNYAKSPYYEDVTKILTGLSSGHEETISQLNIRLIRRICEYLEISTPMVLSSDLDLSGTKTDRLIDLLGKLNATTYLSGPSADGYLDKDSFRRHGIRLKYKSYDYQPYPQLWGEFDGAVTVLDLIANCGPESLKFIRSQLPDTIVVQ